MTKKKVAIAVDSTACIPQKLIEKYNIHEIPLVINWEGETLKDGIDITPDAFYQRLGNTSAIPTTSQPSVGEFVEFYQKIAETAESVVGIYISDDLSGTLSSARTATEMVSNEIKIENIDSRTTAIALGLIALEAARAAEEGQSFEEVAALARSLIDRVRIIFVVDTLDYLHRGGRIGSAQRLVGSMLSIRPLLHVTDGKVAPLASVRTKKKAIRRMFDEIEAELGGKPPVALAPLHASSPSEAAQVRAFFEQTYPDAEIIDSELTPVIGTHVGPGAVGAAVFKAA